MTTTDKSNPIKVLMIDDSKDALVVMGTVLESLGVKVTTAQESKVGAEIAQQSVKDGTPYNLILLDIHMPEMNGIDTAKMIRASGYKGAIVAFTAHATVSGKKEGKEAGIDGYFSKTTFKKDVVQALLDQYCN